MKRERKNNIFTDVPVSRVNRNLFDLSHEVKMSGKFGNLYPVLCMEALPGDTVRENMSALVRFAPLVSPVMHRMDITTHFFFVPNRLLWDAWEEFITGGQDGTAAPVPPYYTPAGLVAHDGNSNRMGKGTVWDYFGLPIAPSSAPAAYSTERVSALPFWAMAKIWNDFYRDPNLDEEMEIPSHLEGDVSSQTFARNGTDLMQRGFEKDYFTSALPWAQRGAQVLMPLAGVASSGDIDYMTGTMLRKASDGTAAGTGAISSQLGAMYTDFGGANSAQVRVENIDSITFDNAETTINDWRRALAIQKWLENNARGGARYNEQIQSHFSVTVPDYRLQRAEYLGGGKQPVQISEVVTTADTTDAKVGELAGHALSVGQTNQFTYRCQEHGYIIGIVSVTMRTAYSQGIPRMFSKSDKFDYAWPELANLGEQEIKSKELFFSFDNADAEDNDSVFGYIPRYAEYKFMNDRIAGDFRDTLHYWHLGRYFTQRPSLDSAFTTIHEKGDGGTLALDSYESNFRRIFSVYDSIDYLWFQLYHRLTAKRPLPYFGVPQIG